MRTVTKILLAATFALCTCQIAFAQDNGTTKSADAKVTKKTSVHNGKKKTVKKWSGKKTTVKDVNTAK